jgi:eukaryotic-like serine/threonine-protein kinase
MHEDPTLPIGVDQVARPEAPTVSTTWGSFTLLARVGFGGFGEVYRAWDPHLQREVALKLLLPGAVGGEAEYEAMLREARALASVRHPNIVPVHGIDRHDGRVGFWTDFVRGKTLSVLVGEQGTFGAREAALIGLDVTRALSAVHRAGLLHRDIKAENVMREEGGRILLMDFGLSSLDHHQANIAGTPNYMAPEFFESGRSTVATDIYAMGVLLYYLVSGDYPVRLSGLTASEALARVSKRTPLMDLRSDLPESLLLTVTTAMEIDPARRFTSAGQLASALAESLGTPVPADVAPVSNERPKKRWKREWIVAATVLAAAMVFGILETSGYLPRLGHQPNESGSALSGSASDQFQKAQDLLLRSYKENNLAQAVTGFQAVLKSDPGNALAEARLGDAYFAQHNYSSDPKLLEMAKGASEMANKWNPDLAAPYVTLSRIAAAQGQTQLAMQQAQKALSLDPRNAEANGALGDVYAAAGRDNDAIAAYQKASDQAPDDWRWPVSLGIAEFGQGKIEESISHLQKGIELAPDNGVAYYDLSIAHMQSNRLDDARQDLERALKIEPTAREYSALGSVLLLQGKYDDAASMYKKAIQLNPGSFGTWANLGNAYQWTGTKREQAAQAYRKAVELGEAQHERQGQDPVLLASLAQSYAAIGNTARSLILIRQALALSPDNPTVAYRVGETYETLGQRGKAIPLIASAIANGYSTQEFVRNPQLASLRADPAFNTALDAAKQKRSGRH